MVLNKYRKNIKWKYDGERIVKIGQQELYPRVYRKYWDLRQYENLEKYNLSPKIYNYIGYSTEKLQSTRHAKWFNNILKNHHVNPVLFNFVTNLTRFYKEELNYSDIEVKQNIRPIEEILCRCANKEIALRKEKEITGRYYLLSKLKPNKYVLLSDKDSYFKLVPNKKDNSYTLTINN